MRSTYQKQLSALTAQLAEMCAKTGRAMGDATQAVLRADLALAERVIARHVDIAAMAAHAEEQHSPCPRCRRRWPRICAQW